MDRRTGLALVGGLLIALGLGVWLAGDFSVAARQAPRVIRFAGAARALAGLAPILVGMAFFGLARGADDGAEPRWPQLAIAGGIAAALTAFMLAQRG